MKGSKKHNKYRLTPRNLSEEEFQNRLDLYSKGDQNQFFKIQKIKKRYQNQQREELDKRAKSDLFFAHGIRAALPHTSFENIKYAREQADQDLRDGIVEEAKSEYRRHENLSKWFSHEKDKELKLEDTTRQSDKTKAYKKLGSLMAEYSAVKDVRDQTKEQIKKIQADPENLSLASSLKTPELDQKSLSKIKKKLSKYFSETEPSPKELRKSKGMDRTID
ncbi:MAG: hypothetical protein R8N23_10445 [Reichenbachiella sp.]|uniref:hypothetical protein n=1 Tax=Reichenbachiella sp. TaxID=2184521 RepID=UPI0029672D8D|nr:hypothetical protein [Reichenbachiella sp.]MDW3210277.1 hypothetical protein [Reichenbachiella sp.]